jgi:hypothetical protein
VDGLRLVVLGAIKARPPNTVDLWRSFLPFPPLHRGTDVLVSRTDAVFTKYSMVKGVRYAWHWPLLWSRAMPPRAKPETREQRPHARDNVSSAVTGSRGSTGRREKAEGRTVEERRTRTRSSVGRGGHR